MAWSNTVPSSAKSPSASTVDITSNWDWLGEALSAEHVSIQTANTAGRHLPGRCGVVKYGTQAAIAALSNIEHAIGYATDVCSFYVNTGAAWTERSSWPSGTKAIFYQATAPLGWTIDTDATDKVVIITDAQGGSETGGTTLGSWSISGITMNHRHSYTEIPNHTHNLSCYGGFGATAISYYYTSLTTKSFNTSTVGDATCYTEYSSAGIVTDGSWRPAYAKSIICTKN